MTRQELLRAANGLIGGTAAAAGGALLLACGQRGADAPTPVPEDVTVTVAVRAGERVAAVLEKTLPAVRYGFAPGAGSGMPTIREIPIVSTPGRSFVDGVRQRAAAGETPDVVWFSQRDDLPAILRGDLLRPLNPFLDNDAHNTLEGYHPESLRALRFWGRQMALPAALGVLAVRYDAEALAEREVAPPQSHWTWDEFAAKAAALTYTANGGTVWGFGTTAVPAWLLFIVGAGGRAADLDAGATTLDQPEALVGLRFWLDLAQRYYALEGGAQASLDAIVQRRAQGSRASLRLTLINWHNEEPASWPLGFVGPPRGPAQAVPLLVSDMVGVAAHSGQPEAAYAVAKPLAAQLGSNLLVPPRNNAIEFIRRPDRRHADLALGLDRADVVLRSLSYSVGTTLSLYNELGLTLTERMALPALRGSLAPAAALERGAAAVREWLGPPPR